MTKKMKSRLVTIEANDGDVAIEVTIRITPRKGYPLEETELDELQKKACRGIGLVLSGLPYSDFGFENTRLKPSEESSEEP